MKTFFKWTAVFLVVAIVGMTLVSNVLRPDTTISITNDQTSEASFEIATFKRPGQTCGRRRGCKNFDDSPLENNPLKIDLQPGESFDYALDLEYLETIRIFQLNESTRSNVPTNLLTHEIAQKNNYLKIDVALTESGPQASAEAASHWSANFDITRLWLKK